MMELEFGTIMMRGAKGGEIMRFNRGDMEVGDLKQFHQFGDSFCLLQHRLAPPVFFPYNHTKLDQSTWPP
jgi:hypothetical protein